MLLVLLLLGALAAYTYILNKRLTTPHPAAYAHAAKYIPDNELAALEYPTPEDMANAAGMATGKAYVVVGGSGFAGRYVVRTLLGRGETLVRIVDIAPPDLSGDPTEKDHLSHAEYIKADITNFESIKDAISRPFGSGGATAQVIIHTAAAIRASERLSYVKDISCKVNIDGVKNALRASQELGSVRAFVFTSSAAVFLPDPKYLRIIRKYGPVFNGDVPDGMPLMQSHYAYSKREADALVRKADRVKGVRTGVLRPGMAIMGAGDMWVTHTLSNPNPNIIMGGQCFQSTINVWDLARAHLQFADALEARQDEVGGLGFTITGQSTTHIVNDVRRMMQFFCSRDLRFQPVPAVPFYIFSHFLEIFFMARYYLLHALSKLTGKKATYVPQWAVSSRVDNLQPSAWDYLCSDYIIDDSEVRKVLGYRNLWSNEQTIKWIVESFEGRAE